MMDRSWLFAPILTHRSRVCLSRTHVWLWFQALLVGLSRHSPAPLQALPGHDRSSNDCLPGADGRTTPGRGGDAL